MASLETDRAEQVAAFESQVEALSNDKRGLSADAASKAQRITELESRIEALSGAKEIVAAEAERRAEQIAASESQIAALESQVADLETQLEGLTGDRASVAAESARRAEQVADLETRLADLETHSSELESRRADLETGKADLEARLAEVSRERDTLSTDAESLAVTISDLEARIEDTLATMRDREASLTAELEAAHADAAAFKSRAGQQATDAATVIESLEEQLSASTREVDALNLAVATAKADGSATAASVREELDAVRAETEATVADLRAELERVEAQRADVEAQRADAEAQRADAEARHEAHAADLARKHSEALSAAKQQLSESETKLRAEIESLVATVSTRDAEVGALTTRIAARDRELADTNARLDELTIAAQSAVDSSDSARVRIRTLEAEREQFTESLTQREQEISRLNDESLALREQYSSFAASLAARGAPVAVDGLGDPEGMVRVVGEMQERFIEVVERLGRVETEATEAAGKLRACEAERDGARRKLAEADERGRALTEQLEAEAAVKKHHAERHNQLFTKLKAVTRDKEGVERELEQEREAVRQLNKMSVERERKLVEGLAEQEASRTAMEQKRHQLVLEARQLVADKFAVETRLHESTRKAEGQEKLIRQLQDRVRTLEEEKSNLMDRLEDQLRKRSELAVRRDELLNEALGVLGINAATAGSTGTPPPQDRSAH
jgi:chromosome segregation ATPase